MNSPIINHAGHLILSCCNGIISSYSIDSNERRNCDLGCAVHGGPAVDKQGNCYICSTDQQLYAFKKDGTLNWKRKIFDISEQSPLIGPDGTIYLNNQSGRIYAVSPDNELLWQNDLNQTSADAMSMDSQEHLLLKTVHGLQCIA